MTGFFDATGREMTPAELRARRAALDLADQPRIVIELLDADGNRVTTLAQPLHPTAAALVASARIIPDTPEVPNAVPR
jgi:hypothetical protein